MLGALFYQVHVLVSIMLWLLLSPTDNARSMFLSSIGKYHASSALSPSDNAWCMVL